MLEAREISIGYGAAEVVRGVSLAVNDGEIVVVLGANGAGKTTLLRALNGALPLGKGELWLDGKSLTEFSRREIARKITVVAQENQTQFPVKVLEFVLSGRFARASGAFGWETERDLAIAQNALRQCDLENFERRLINRLSGGERQRAVFARALVTEAKILLLDEPTANLDLLHQSSILRLVRGKCDNEGFSAVVITHDLNLAAEFADRILLLKKGETVAQGETTEVLTEQNLREAFGVQVLLDTNPASGKVRLTTVF